MKARLMMGDELEVIGNLIRVGTASIDFGRPVEDKDIESVMVVYAMGAAARSRHVHAAWDALHTAITPIFISGFSDDTERPDPESDGDFEGPVS